jgi:hypothetical protein
LAEVPQSSGWRIQDLLTRLAGDGAPTVSLGVNEAGRQKCRDAWLAWWDKEGAKIDLAKLDGAAPALGYTLLVVRDPRVALGRVMEVNAAKEVLWKIEGLNLPMDALVVGKDRVLIAEQGSPHQVTERDFRGTVIWSKQVPMPVGLQRLPNGNTLVVSRNQIAEWDAEHNPVYTYHRNVADITAATKLRGGEFMLLTSQGACVRLSEDRKEIKTFQITPRPVYHPFGGIEGLPSGNLLVTQRDSVVECDPSGNSIWSAPIARPGDVQRLSNGNTIVVSTANYTVSELDRAGQSVWEYKFTDGTTPYRARRR